jgi:hypothetical protein
MTRILVRIQVPVGPRVKLTHPSLWPGEPERRLGGRPILGFSFFGVTRGGWVCSILLAVA